MEILGTWRWRRCAEASSGLLFRRQLPASSFRRDFCTSLITFLCSRHIILPVWTELIMACLLDIYPFAFPLILGLHSYSKSPVVSFLFKYLYLKKVFFKNKCILNLPSSWFLVFPLALWYIVLLTTVPPHILLSQRIMVDNFFSKLWLWKMPFWWAFPFT